MNILFADKFPSAQLESLRSAGHHCDYQPALDAADLPSKAASCEAIVVRSTKVGQETIESASQLRLIIRAGAGTNTIDKDFAASRDVAVCNVPGKNAVAVAELTMGLLLAIDRNIPDNVQELRAGRWNKKRYSAADGLYGKSIGIVGAGAIGMSVAERAHAFGMKIHMIEKSGRPEQVQSRMDAMSVTGVSDLMEMARECQIVTFHVPAVAGTRHLVNREFLDELRDGAIVLNTSRGDVVDEGALIEAMDRKSIRAGLDVYDAEPAAGDAEFDSPLAKHPNVYGTHHIGASTEQAQTSVAEGVVEIVNAFMRGSILNRVN